MSLLTQTCPALPAEELLNQDRPTPSSLWRWLPASFALHLTVLLVWELGLLAPLLSLEATLPVKSGQQAINVQLVSASTAFTKPETQPAPVITTPHGETPMNAPQTTQHKKKTVPAKAIARTSTPAHAQNQNNQLALAKQPEGVYSEAKTQSSNKPEYPRMAVLKNQQGKVVIRLDIDAEGRSHNIQLVKSSGFTLLDNAVISFAKMERFIPARNNSAPVKTTQQYSFLFKLI